MRGLPSRRDVLLAGATPLLGWPSAALPLTAPALTFLPQPGRIVAIGDIHGDCDAFERVLELSGLYRRAAGWTGGNAVLVQIGDILDRGGQEMECLRLLRVLKREAAQQDGAVAARWAHNPQVARSKLAPAIFLVFFFALLLTPRTCDQRLPQGEQ